MNDRIRAFSKMLENINAELAIARQGKFTEINRNRIACELLEIARGITAYLNAEQLLDSWSKSQIIRALNALMWSWLHLSTCCLQKSICDKAEISPEIKYDEEIIHTHADEILTRIDLLEKLIASI